MKRVIVFTEVLFEIGWYTYILLKSFISLSFVFFKVLYQDESSVPELSVNIVTTGGSLILSQVLILYPRVSRALYFDRMNITEFLN